jgi:hypothetical protein
VLAVRGRKILRTVTIPGFLTLKDIYKKIKKRVPKSRETIPLIRFAHAHCPNKYFTSQKMFDNPNLFFSSRKDERIARYTRTDFRLCPNHRR